MIKAVVFDMYETLITHYKCPLYFSAEMAEDAGMRLEKFLPDWRKTDTQRSTGKMTFEEIIKTILTKNHCYSEEVYKKILQKRMQTKEECFRQLHEGIIPMLEGLHERNIKIGLISNCFSEEVTAIRNSILFPYFDVACLSYEQGLMKPDLEIYRRCLEELQVSPKECIYVGDGGSQELQAAREAGIEARQAAWYFDVALPYQSARNPAFRPMDDPKELLDYIDERLKEE